MGPQKGKIIQINSIKAVDGTSIPVFYNLNNEGKSSSFTAVGVGILLFWLYYLLKENKLTIEWYTYSSRNNGVYNSRY